MRRLLAGIFLFALSFPVAALAETKGEVEAIGFGSLYRPNCHIPMLVRVQADKSGTYQIRVVQDDLDADQPLFTQIVSLTGSDDGGPGSEQRFWLYFIPQPTDGGLPDVTDGLRAIQSTLKVFLCDENGRQITQLPVTSTIQNIEKAQAGPFSTPRGVKVVLAIAAGGAQPVWRDYQQAIGTIEDVVIVPLRVTDLPEDARGYEMVDAIVWLNAPPPDPALAADEKRYHALREYVRGGGHMVICQPAQRDATEQFKDLLPVDVQAIAPRDNLQPLRRIATAKRPVRGQRDEFDEPRGPMVDDWDLPKPDFMFARATLKKGAVADELLAWNADGSDTSPYLARIGYGGGCVSWVAHDLSDPAITARAKSGWPFVWDRVLDFKHDTLIIDNRTTDDQKRPYQAGATMDVGFALLKGMELKSKSQLLVTIAVVFFIAYWIVAGPGVYLYLVTKSRPQLSWFMFAFSALVATVLTVLIVRLVVRGAPEMSHVTLVRAAPDAPALAISRFGLYIPRDGAQDILLPEIAPRAVSYLTAYPAHPSHLAGADIEFPAHMQYVVPTRDPTAEEPVKISVPYRSTLKQFQARRVGQAGGAVEGKPVLREVEGGYGLEGTLVNATGYRLKNVYLIYYQPPASELRREGETEGDDFIYYLPAWEKSQSINLATEFDRSTRFIGLPREAGNLTGYPEQGIIKLRGRVGRAGQEEGWSRFWYSGLKNNGFGNQQLDDLDKPVSKAYPMMSIYGRLPPMRNMSSGGQTDRVEILRRGGRNLDCSAAIAAGRLVVLAEADGKAPLPFPLEVEGDKVEGSGTLLFQSILPMERIDLPPTTQPSATQPGAGGGATAATTGPTSGPTVSATLADEPPTPKVTFDPTTFNGNLADLSPDQRNQVFQYRRDQQIKARQQRRQPPQQQSGQRK